MTRSSSLKLSQALYLGERYEEAGACSGSSSLAMAPRRPANRAQAAALQLARVLIAAGRRRSRWPNRRRACCCWASRGYRAGRLQQNPSIG